MTNNKKKVFEKLKNTFCRIQRSKIHGVGVFSMIEMPKNTDPFYGTTEQRWFKFSESELGNLNKEVRKMTSDFFGMDKKRRFSIPECGLNSMDISFFLNSSEKPNIKTIDDGVSFRTLRKIKSGEELTVSYRNYDIRYK